MRRLSLLVLALVPALALANPVQTFSPGSLVIPMQANFQTDCGITSAYGLVWKLLYENRTGGAFAGTPVTIYWVINDGKQSPNRCVPTNKHASPLPSTFGVGTAGWDNPASNPWTDGCDFSIPSSVGVESTAMMPVVPVDWSTAYPTVGTYPTTNPILEYDTNSRARPWYTNSAASTAKGYRPAAGELNNTGTCASAPCGNNRFSKIQYSGGAFVIDVSDAKRVIDAIRNAGSYPHLNLHQSNSGSCAYGSNWRVNIHQATQSFDAPIYKRISKVPPKIALLDFGAGIKTVLQDYLDLAGLSGSIGANAVAGTPSTGTTGIVYDRLRAIDDLVTTVAEPNGYLNSKVGLKSRYKVFWAPHWEPDNSSLLTNAGCASTCNPLGTSGSSCGGACNASGPQITDAMNNIAFFANQKGNGIMAECASIEGFEGSTSGITNYTPNTNFHFDNTTTTTQALVHNGLSSPSGRNCSDPDYLAAAAPRGKCMRYLEPGDPFAQVGDLTFGPTGGHVDDYRISSGGTRKAGVKRLASAWENGPNTLAYSVTNPSGMGAWAPDDTGNNGWDFFTLGNKDNDPEKATVIYVAGHDLSGNVAGTRVVLNTLLNLGADPIPSDRNYTAAVGMIDSTNSNLPTVFSSIYAVINGTPPTGAIDYSPANGKNWMFPFTAGNLRAKNATSLVNGENELNDAVFWNADAEIPLPNDRNLFTYFGGEVRVNPTLSASRKVRNDVVQMGWVPERIEYTRINDSYGSSPNPNCVDVQKYGDYVDRFSGVDTEGLVPGSDGICDLQEALQWSGFTPTITSGKHSIPPGHLTQMSNEVPKVQQFYQRVRGFCFATRSELGIGGSPDEIFTPTDANCIDMGGMGDNRAHMGGAVRSTAAVVTWSAKVPESCAVPGCHRPTVAYIGTWDGQLHAIYVGGGLNYSGSSVTAKNLNLNATQGTAGISNVFKTDYAAMFAGGTTPNRGTELWSFLPPSQLPHLLKNNARIDSSPVVSDAFVDIDGDGVREWHTILVVSIGGTGRELFAMDVSDPLKPVLLWDIIGSHSPSATINFSGAPRSDFDLTGTAKPLQWNNVTAEFEIDPNKTDTGRTVGYAYDYGDLGGSRSLSIGQMREGLEPVTAVFVASNVSGLGAGAPNAAGRAFSAGLAVFAVDIATGQKIWQWRQPYVVVDAFPTNDFRSAANTVPPPVSVRTSVDGASLLYVGDMEGRMWELDAASGRNMNALRETTGSCSAPAPACNFPIFDTRGTKNLPEPITSNLGLGVTPSSATASTPLWPYTRESILVVGTAGTDWVPGTVSGKVHTLLLKGDPVLTSSSFGRRKPVIGGVGPKLDNTASGFHATQVWDLSSVRASAGSTGPVGDYGGVLQNPVGMPLGLTGGNRVYGNLTIIGETVFVPLVTGQGGDPMNVAKTLAGATLEIPLGAVPATEALAKMSNFNYANFGGVAVFVPQPGGAALTAANGGGWVIGDEVGKTAMKKPSTLPATTVPNAQLSGRSATVYRVYNAIRRFWSQQ